jgi:drug/metabolite transporter superfamily protein YnfA
VDNTSEFELIQDTYIRTWQIFISWYTWFSNINLIALGWIVTSQRVTNIGWFVLLMEFLTIAGLGAIVGLWSYCRSAHERVRSLAQDNHASKLPKHGVIATLGENHFAYHAFANYHGPDEYVIRACATVGERQGCSKLTYQVVVH